MTRFWPWLVHGAHGGKPGLAQMFWDWKVLVYIAVAAALAWLTADQAPSDMARAIVLSMVGILTGLCFAWGGNAAALIHSRELEAIIDARGKGVEDYIFGYQLAILTMLVVTVGWGLAALKVFDKLECISNHMIRDVLFYMIRGVLFFLAVVGVNQCWRVVSFATTIMHARYYARKSLRERDNADAQPGPDNAHAPMSAEESA